MSIHRQRSRKDLGDAAGAFGHRLFEAKKRRALLALAMRRLALSSAGVEAETGEEADASSPGLGAFVLASSSALFDGRPRARLKRQHSQAAA